MIDWADYYRKAWAKRAGIMRQLIEQSSSLPRVLGQFDWWERHNELKMNNETGEMFYAPRFIPAPKASANATELLFDLAHGCDTVIEYGCGYGKQLLHLSLAGCELPMLGVEPAQTGVDLGRRLASLDEDANVGFITGGFDYRPEKKHGLPLVFTHYSAMYQDPFPEKFFNMRARMVFIEPINDEWNTSLLAALRKHRPPALVYPNVVPGCTAIIAEEE